MLGMLLRRFGGCGEDSGESKILIGWILFLETLLMKMTAQHSRI
jgi:hypothetical protein